MDAQSEPAQVRMLTREEARVEFDAQARRHLGMSGDEFVAAWDAGKFEDPDQPDIMLVAMLLCLVR
ncbi:MAG: hypothetical protein ACR2HB_17105 [Dehalococcoidia bacterium]